VSASEDQTDVARVLAGDPSAFEGIVRRWQGPLVNLAYRFCRDRGRAEEMAQDAFLRAYRALGTWRGESAFSTWLFALAMNVYRSHVRRVPLVTVPIDLVAEPGADASHGADMEDVERDRTIRRAVGTLPDRYRDAMVAFYFHDMDVATAAKTLHLAEGTLKARLFRARDLLRRKLERVLS
jgi:RNA polymerase sigma-70 factor (ECF subfamily)